MRGNSRGETDLSDRAQTRGIALVALAGVIWSLQSIAIRIVEDASGVQIVFWRSVSQFVSILLIIALVNRGHVILAFRRNTRLAIVGGLCAMCASTSFVFAIVNTTIANVVFIMAASPLFAALGGWLLMGERIERRSVGAMVVAVAGIGVMVWEGIAAGSLIGYLFSLTTTLGFAGIAIVARRGGGIDMLPMVGWGAAFNIVAGLILSGGEVQVTWFDAAACFGSGGVLTTIGATCFMHGARYVPAGVLAFITLTEIVLAPIWAWWGFGEVPSPYALAGGAIVLGAIVVEAVLRIRTRDEP